LEGVHKRYGEVRVVHDLDLEIADREFFTFVGPSGCGKSTLLNMIAGLEGLSGGALYFDQDEVGRLSPGERDVAMVFQSYALYPHMSVFDNLAFPLRVKRMARREVRRQVEQVAASLGLEGLLRRKPRELSGGQRQRVALGRALVRRPRVFLMDEPLSNLDARLRMEMREEIKRIHNEFRITTIYVTHDQEEAMVLSERVAVLNQGRIEQCGGPLEIYERPANLFVAGFIGSPAINVLEARHAAVASGLSTALHCGGKEVVIGVRPADVSVTAQAQPEAIAAEVMLIEPTGSDVWVVGQADGSRIKGRALPGETFRPGAPAWFRLAPERVHLFDKATGIRLKR
jgi:multiple sugar transport system ATP-binding protein